MNRSDMYYAPAELEYRRQRAARAHGRTTRRGRRWPRNRGAAQHGPTGD
jgi:hypothetical protein